MQVPDNVKILLNEAVERINTPAFIADDPVQLPRMFGKLQDIEIASLITAQISWGKRAMILRNARRILEMMHFEPYAFVMSGEYETFPGEQNLHRTFFVRDLQYYLRGLQRVYRRWPSIDAMVSETGIGDSEAPAWRLAEILHAEMLEANRGEVSNRCIPNNLASTALKRLNMALRWLVRTDGIVDMGVWQSVSPSRLFIPLDVHVSNVSRRLGLLSRRQSDRRAVEELTAVCRTLNSADPAIYDFALFGLGVSAD